jgi:hypothetical protein
MVHSRPARKVRAYRPRLEVLEDRALLSTYLVDHMADDTVGTGLSGSLRYAITHAVNGDTITFGVTGTINLTGALPGVGNISINGPGADLLTVRRDTGQALTLLRRARSAGLFKNRKWIEIMKKDADLAGLRSREDFKKFVAELEAAAKP